MKKQSQYMPSLFEPQTSTTETNATEAKRGKESSPPKIKDACPKCGGRSLKTVRAHEHDGLTNYCAAGCLSDDRTDCFYFTPRAESFDEQAEREGAKAEARAVIASEPVEVHTEVVGEGQQQALIETGEKWEEHWKGMPEFVQEDLTPWKSIYVHFETRADMERFAKLVKQTVTANTRSIWYPEAEIGRMATKKYIDKGAVVDVNTKNDDHRSGAK